MKDRIFTAFPMFLLFTILNIHAENPIIQTNFTADPAPMVYHDTVFLYTGHDDDNASGFAMYDYLLYTSTDLVNWTDHGVIASSKSFKWANNNGAWAAQCIPRNGKFYYYCAQQLKGIGVLVSNSPYGPFTDPLGKPIVNNGGPCIDPTVFIDDDGQAYLYWGNPDAYYVKLNQDMISYSGSIVMIPRMQSYQEGPWFYKRNKHYYLAWASTCCPEGIGYAMSDGPTGPWTFKGSIMDGNSNSSGNHPGIIDYKGKSYVFGFNYAINYSWTSVHHERRSICVSEMNYNSDGTIPKLAWFGKNLPEPGIPQVGTFNPYDTVQAETICFEKGVRTEVCKDVGGGMDVDSIHNGDYIKVKGIDFGTSGAKSFDARLASGASGGSIELHLDTLSGPLVGTITVAGTGGWQTWTTKSCSISGAKGVHNLFLKFTGGSGMLFNFNWWKFYPVDPTDIKISMKNGTECKGNVKIITTAGKEISVKFNLPQSFSQKNLYIYLYDISGKLIAKTIGEQSLSSQPVLLLHQKEMRAGTYLLKVTANNRLLFSRNVIVN